MAQLTGPQRSSIIEHLGGTYHPKEGDDLIEAVVACGGCGCKGVKEPGSCYPKGWFTVQCVNGSIWHSGMVCSPACASASIGKALGE